MTTAGLKFGIYPAPLTPPWDALLERARQAEAWGFDALWVADQTPMAYPGMIEFDAWPLLGALAGATADIRLGTLVSPAFLRHPLALAHAATTLDHVSGGRLSLGLGAGGSVEDLAGMGMAGTSRGELVGRLAEATEIVDALLRGETVTRAGRFWQIRGAVVPRPVQQPRPPLVIAAAGLRSMDVVARYADTWNSLGGQPVTGERLTLEEAIKGTARQVAALEHACQRAGRAVGEVGLSAFAWRAGVFAAPGAFEDWVGRYRELGFTEFMLWWPSKPEQQRVLELIASDVIPRLRAG